MSDDLEALAALDAIAREFDLDALTVRARGVTYELVRRPEPTGVTITGAAAPATAESAAVAPGASAAPVITANYKKVAAPIIGVFYRSAAPGTPSFVESGDRVEIGQVLCILEAMKLMNEITSDHAGIVRKILPENGALVSLGEEMFWIEPQ